MQGVRLARWRGLKALVHDAVDGTTGLVDEGQRSVHRAIRHLTDEVPPAAAVEGLVRLGSAGTLATVRAVNRVVEALTDAALDASLPPEPDGPVLPLRSDVVGSAGWIADAALGAVNGAIGDHLAQTGNGLDLGLRLRFGDEYRTAPATPLGEATAVVLVHGLGTTEWCWALEATDRHGDPGATFGSMLARDCGVVPIFARYNTGRPVARNGRALAEALDTAFAGGVRRVVLVGHSMGGLVAREACRVAAAQGLGWVRAVDLVVSIGTPHQGAPLARFGQTATTSLASVDLPATRILARLLAARSLGIRDLEHGETAVGEPEVEVPHLPGVRYAFLSATVTRDPEHPASRWLGDLLVRVDSAGGPVPAESPRSVVFGGVLHHQLQVHPAVYEEVRRLVGEGT